MEGVVVCHHPFGIGVHIESADQYAQVDVSCIRDGVIRGAVDYPPIGQALSGMVVR